jgi:hypothetical protein
MMSWPSSLYRYLRYSSATARVPLLSTFLSTTATAGLGQDADRGRDDVELGAELLFQQEGLVLPGDQHVALVALGEGDGRAARTGVQHRHVGEQLGDEVLRLGVAAVLALANSQAAR